MAKNKYKSNVEATKARIDNAIRLANEAQQRQAVYERNVAAQQGQQVLAPLPNQSAMQRQQAQAYQQAAEQQRMQEDPYGNRAREPEAGFFKGKPGWTETQGIYSPETVQSLNRLRPSVENNFLNALNQQAMQRPSFLDQLQESDAYAPYMYDNLLGDPEQNIGMGGNYSNILGPLTHAFVAQNVIPHVPGLLQRLGQYLGGNQPQQNPWTVNTSYSPQVSMSGINSAQGMPLTNEQVNTINRNYYNDLENSNMGHGYRDR